MERWLFDFLGCCNRKAATEAFVQAVNGTGISDESGREIEVWACIEVHETGKIVVGHHETDLTALEVHELVDDWLNEVYVECCRAFDGMGRQVE